MKCCKKCGDEKPFDDFPKESRVKDGRAATCRACCNLRDNAWRLANPERAHAINVRWRANHPGETTKRARAWRLANRERHNTACNKWARNHKDKVLERKHHWNQANKLRLCLYQHARRTRERNARGAATPTQIEARIALYGARCWRCDAPFQALDHVIPLTKGGTNWPANFRPICKPCNSSKGAKHPRALPPRPIIEPCPLPA